MERSVNQIQSQNTDGFLLKNIRGIPHVDVQQNIVGWTAGLQLKAQTNPAMGIVGSRIVARRNGINEGKEASLRPAGFLQLGKQLGPLVLEHGFKPLPRDIARTRAVEIVADFLIVCGDGFRDRAGGSADNIEPARNFLSGADFGKRTEGSRIEI